MNRYFEPIDDNPKCRESFVPVPESLLKLSPEQKLYFFYPELNSIETVFFLKYNDDNIPIVQRKKDYWTRNIALNPIDYRNDTSYWTEEIYKRKENYEHERILVTTELYDVIKLASENDK